MKPATMVTVLFLAMVAVAHLLRLVLRVEVIIGGTVMPLWVSVIAGVVPAGLAVALWRESGKT
jgi:uncharacterized membrane protein